MKRLLLAALLALLAPAAWAQCTSNAACATTPCTFNAAGTWTAGAGCTVPPNAAGETWIIQAGHTVLFDQATQTTGTGTVQGTMMWDPGTANRDAAGFHSLVVTTTANDTGISCANGGKIVMRNSDRLRFDTTAGRGRIALFNGCIIDFRGTAFDTTVAAISAADDDAAPCGNATPIGREWTVTPAGGIGLAKVGRRVIFKSGKLVNRHFEIVAVSSPTLTLCSSLADGSSVGERLTPYGTAPGAPPGPGTVGHHTVPLVTADSDAAMCTGAGAPWPCCSGAGAGNCPTPIDPVIGDAMTIVDDWYIDQSAGTANWAFQEAGDGTLNCGGSACSGLDPYPIFQYGNWNGFGGNNGSGGIAAQFGVRSANQFIPDFIGNNLHGFKSDYGPVFKGPRNAAFTWNAIHDSQDAAGTHDSKCQFNIHQQKISENGLVDSGPADLDVSHNIAWRTKSCAIQINDGDNGSEVAAVYQAERIKLNNNLVYGYCSVAGGTICGAIQIQSCINCQARRNVIFDGFNGTPDGGDGIQLSGQAGVDGLDVSDNWITNMGGIAIKCADDTSAPVTNLAVCHKATMVNNYISHVRDAGGRGGNWYGFVIKNFGLNNSSGGVALRNPIHAHVGYWGIDSAVASTTLCTSSINRCSRGGISWALFDGNRNATNVTVSDVIFGRWSENAGAGNRLGMENDGLGALTVADFGGTISHITQDGKATGGNGYSRLYDFSNTNPSVPVTWTVSDLLAAYKADDTLVDCSTAGNVTDTIGNAYSLKTDTASEGGGAYSANCSSSGTLTRVAQISWNNRDAFDYGLRVGSPEYTAGVGGTAIGSRVFRFNRDRITLPWASAIVYDNDMPVNFSTGTSNVDTDGDGVIDLFDNCDSNFNPNQADTDTDGIGDVCD